MSNTYRFKTIQEAVDIIPADKLELCFTELGKTYATAKTYCEMLYVAVSELAKKNGKELPPMPQQLFLVPEEHVWVDDGKGKCVLNFGEWGKVTLKKEG